MKIVVSFGFARSGIPFGGIDFGLGYVAGLARLGHEVILIEEVNQKACFDENYHPIPFDRWKGREVFSSVVRAEGLEARACLIFNPGRVTWGMSFEQAASAAKEADLLLNFAGCLKDPEILLSVDLRAYIDRNPATEQVYSSEYGVDYGMMNHQFFFTSGLNIGRPECEIPTCGLPWRGSLIPVVLERWPMRGDPGTRPFTTISGWGGRETFEFRGTFSGEKIEQWRRFIDLPEKTRQELEIAVSTVCDDQIPFRKKGWRFADTRKFQSQSDYQNYIACSRGEFTVANDPFVQYQVGWCGDRISRYLASGRPVVVQSSGFEGHLPVGKGLLSFSTIDEAADAIAMVNADYRFHSHGARRLAEEFFDSDMVLGKILEAMGIS